MTAGTEAAGAEPPPYGAGFSLQIPLDCFARLRISIRRTTGLAMTGESHVATCSHVIARAEGLNTGMQKRRLQSSPCA